MLAAQVRRLIAPSALLFVCIILIVDALCQAELTLTSIAGLVGGWITTHLLERGEDAKTIRVLDLQPPKQAAIVSASVMWLHTDITSTESVEAAFRTPWDAAVAHKPLTVFHTAAYISAANRYPVFLPPYTKINVEGARNVLFAARLAGCTAFIATSSGSISIRPPSLIAWPWQAHPKGHFQFHSNAEPMKDFHLGKPTDFGSCYAFSKAQAEYLITSLSSPELPTGAIRPCHSIYGTGVENPSSISYDYMRRGGNPTWIAETVTQFVDARNVSAAHLALEDKLIDPRTTASVAGRAYAVMDPNPPVTYGHLYDVLETLAHPKTPVHFPLVSAMPFIIVAYMLETYDWARASVPALFWLPALKGDAAKLQPAIFNMCTLNVVYDDKRAQEELGYRGIVNTLDGLCEAVRDWNNKVEARERKSTEAAAEQLQTESQSVVPPVKM